MEVAGPIRARVLNTEVPLDSQQQPEHQTMQLLCGFSAFFLTLAILYVAATPSNYYLDYESSLDEGYDIAGERLQYAAPIKRGCIARGGNCDHRGDECCESTSCRCNLWGANCRCQRKGIFTKLG